MTPVINQLGNLRQAAQLMPESLPRSQFRDAKLQQKNGPVTKAGGLLCARSARATVNHGPPNVIGRYD